MTLMIHMLDEWMTPNLSMMFAGQSSLNIYNKKNQFDVQLDGCLPQTFIYYILLNVNLILNNTTEMVLFYTEYNGHI